jgi:hypothetical protein
MNVVYRVTHLLEVTGTLAYLHADAAPGLGHRSRASDDARLRSCWPVPKPMNGASVLITAPLRSGRAKHNA